MFDRLLSGDYMPHGHCYLWYPEILWTHVIADTVTAAAYYSIPISIVLFVRKRKDIEFRAVPILFSAFIFLCGSTHLFAIFTIWNGYYGWQGLLKAVTAIVSIATAVFVWRLLPVALSIPSRSELEREVEAATSELQNNNDLLERANSDIRNFVTAATHDLKEPMRTVVSYCELLREDVGDNLSEDAQEDLRHILAGARRMQLMVDDLLTLSTTGRREMRRDLISLDQCIDQVLDSLKPKLEGTGTRVERVPMPVVQGDGMMLEQIYLNLVTNAIKYANPESSPVIRFTMDTTDDGERIFGVMDNGVGIDAAYREKIFQPFARLHGREHSEGSGIGLAVCRRAIERHKGEIWVEEAPEGGAHFRFTLWTGVQQRDDDNAEVSSAAVYSGH
ncbi:MAG: ATP-binding protein [Woeseiaceae bacterium]|nr:ATP-binding protein [Woeseiaceae bacterium]